MMTVLGQENRAALPSTAELVTVFPFFTPQEIDTFLAYLTIGEWAAGQTLMQDGGPGEFMGFLLDGKLAVKKETVFPGKYILVAVIERGSMVGEISVVEKGQRNATVVAMEKSRLLVLTYENMERMLAENNALGVKLLKRIIHVLGYRLRKASERLSWIL